MDIIILPFLQLFNSLIYFYKWLIIASIILNWLNLFGVLNTHNRFIAIFSDIIYRATEPVLGWIRNRLPSFNGLDLSAFVAIFVLYFIENLINILTIKMMYSGAVKSIG